MTTKIKIAFSMAVAGAVALTLAPQNAQANTISGSISFNGNVTPHTSTDGTGAVATDYSLAHSLVFGQTFVSATPTGSFSTVPQNSTVTMFSPLVVNPPGVPAQPGSGPLWSTDIGGFRFTLTTLSEDVLVSPFNTLTLRGTGTMSDGNPADNNTGTWVATFTTAQDTFSWNSSSSADVPAVPEAGTTFILLGVGLIALGGFAQIRKQLNA